MRTDDLPPRGDTWTAAARQPRRRREFPEDLVPHLAVIVTLWVSWLVVALGAGTWFPENESIVSLPDWQSLTLRTGDGADWDRRPERSPGTCRSWTCAAAC
jgi:hypothetical protein